MAPVAPELVAVCEEWCSSLIAAGDLPDCAYDACPNYVMATVTVSQAVLGAFGDAGNNIKEYPAVNAALGDLIYAQDDFSKNCTASSASIKAKSQCESDAILITGFANKLGVQLQATVDGTIR